MAQSETAKNASPMAGDKPYQKRARRALPLLVRQARARQPITYKRLAIQLDMPNPRNLNYPLGSIGTSLQRLGDDWKQTIPQIQLLVVNKNTGLPGAGVIGFLGFLDDAADLSVAERLKRIEDAQSEVYAYQRWDNVLHALGLKKISPPITSEEILRCRAKRFSGVWRPSPMIAIAGVSPTTIDVASSWSAGMMPPFEYKVKGGTRHIH